MIVLGINAYHGDSSACLVRNGKLVAAAEEERFRRIKHWAGFPTEGIRYCLAEAGVDISNVDHFAVNRNPRANLARKVVYALRRRPSLGLVAARLQNARTWSGIDQALREAFGADRVRGRVHHVEHHLAHLASAFYVSPFDDATVVSVDGFGDFASTAWGSGSAAGLTPDGRVFFPHSLGIFYQALTQYLGFPNYGDEYKVMGLAPYGRPSHMREMERIVRLRPDGSFALDLRYFRHASENVPYEWHDTSPSVGRLWTPALEELLGPARRKDEALEDRHRDIARSVQATYERAFLHLLERLHARYGNERLCLAGGCAMNSVANGLIRRRTPFRHVYIQAAAGDAGGAIGAALQVWHEVAGSPSTRTVMDHAYWGPSFSEGDFKQLLFAHRDTISQANCTIDVIADEDALCRSAAQAIADGQVVGWFQGRMEWGPRALGNRSILGDPRRADMKDILNLKIKRRESFRPFAPSILREHVAEWFEEDDDVPFMMRVFPIRPELRSQIPAVTHVDGSGRLQTVHRDTNPRYHRLIEAFNELTGVPIVLNTSFNENEPVVCRPEEALDCFLRTRMDVLVMGDFLIRRK